MALLPYGLAKYLNETPLTGWKHQAVRTGEVVSLSVEGSRREIEAEQARWAKVAWLRGER